MTATTEDVVHAPTAHTEGHHTSTGLSNAKLGMWAFLGSDCLLFGGLISTFLIMRSKEVVRGFPVSDIYDIPFTSVSSFVLLMSSMTMVLALSGIQRGDHRRARTWILTTALLGLVFVSGQVYEFTMFNNEGLGFTTNLQSSAFYVLTGFHGVHVTVGILMLLSLYVMSLRGHLPTERSETVEIVGLYWHFVDVVWILIFTVVYLIF
jgi:heme/copper-type cytochrome/quinol oxidase subunit 3